MTTKCTNEIFARSDFTEQTSKPTKNSSNTHIHNNNNNDDDDNNTHKKHTAREIKHEKLWLS